MNACGDSRLRGLRSRKPIGFRQWVVHLIDAIEQAVDECIQRNILSEFLRKNKAEVIAMSIFEYDKEEEERKLRKAEYEAGVESGIAEGKRLAQKEGTIALSRLGLPVEQIAMALQVDVELAKQWIGDK